MVSFLKNKSEQKPILLKKVDTLRIGVAVSEWHFEITEKLFEGCFNTLLKNKIKKSNILRYNVPGSYELPLAAQFFLSKKFDAVICLGCVIKGETDHYDFICQSVSNGILNVSLKHNKPVAFGVLTTNNIKQALERAGGALGNKGEDAAYAILKMISIG